MPERLSLATVAACAALACLGFGGAYALAHDQPAKPAPAPAPPTTIQLKTDPVGDLSRVSPLPALIVPPPQPEPTATEPVVETPTTVVPTPAPVTPTPTPAPAPEPEPTPAPSTPAPSKPPTTFDDSG